MSIPWILAASTIGCLLGAFYFGGLWWTIRRLSVSRQPALLFLASFVIRVSVVLLGIYVISAGQWQRIVACMAGFLIARILLVRCLGEVTQIASQSSSSLANAERLTQ